MLGYPTASRPAFKSQTSLARRFSRKLRVPAAFCLLTVFSSVLSADNATWTGLGADSLWSNPENWDVPTGGVAPGFGETATFTSSATVDLEDGIQIKTLYLENNAELDLGGGELALDSGNNLILESTSDAASRISNGFLKIAGSNSFVGTAAGDLVIDAVLSGGAANQTLRLQTGTLGSIIKLNGANTYAGLIRNLEKTLVVREFNQSGTPGNIGTFSRVGLGSNTRTPAIQYLGNGETTDRAIDFQGGTGTVTVEHAGSGRLKFTGDHLVSGAASKVIRLVAAEGAIGEFSGALPDNSASNTTGVTKAGAGDWVLSGSHTYTGATVVESGGLYVDGTLSSASPVTVASGALIGGTALLSSPLQLEGALVPGSIEAPGTFTLGAGATFGEATQLQVRLESSVSYGQLVVSGGNLALDDRVELVVDDSNFTGIDGGPIQIVRLDGSATRSGGFRGLPEGAQIASALGGNWELSYAGGDGNDVTLFFAPAQVIGQQALSATANSAQLQADLRLLAGDAALTLFYGPDDGGEDPSAWASSISMGTGFAAGPHQVDLTGLNPDTRYYYRFKVTHSEGIERWSAAGANFGTLFTGGQSPESLVVSDGFDEVRLTWQENFNSESGFVIERSTSADFTTDVVSFELDQANATAFSDTTAVSGVLYYYRVAAVNAAGTSTWSSGDSGTSNASVVQLAELTLTERSVFDLQEETQKMALRGTRTAGGKAMIGGVEVPMGENNPLYDYGVPTDSSWYIDVYGPDYYTVTEYRESYLHTFDFGNGVVKDLRIIPVYMHAESLSSGWVNRILMDLAYAGEVTLNGTTYIVEVVQGASPVYVSRQEYPGYFDGSDVGVLLYNKATGVRHSSQARLKEIDGVWYSFDSNASGEQLTVSRIDGVATMTIDIGEFWSDDFTFTSGDFIASNGWKIDLSKLDFSSGSAVIPAADYTFTGFSVRNNGLEYQLVYHPVFSIANGSFSLQAGQNANFTFGQRTEVHVNETPNYARDVFGLYDQEAIDFQIRDADIGGAVVPYQPDAGSQDNRCRLVSYENSEGGAITTNWKSHGCGWNGVWGWYTDYREYGLSGRKFILGTDPNPPAVFDTRTISFVCTMSGLYGEVSGSTTINVRNETFGMRSRFYDFDQALTDYPDFDQLLPTLETTSPKMSQTATESAWPGLPAEMADTFAACYEFEIWNTANEIAEFTFHLQTQGAARLYIDGELVLENVSPHAKTDVTAMVTTSAQQRMHARLEYYHNTGPSALSLYADVFTYPYYSGGMQFDPDPGAQPAYLFKAIIPADIAPDVQISAPAAPVTLTAPGAELPLSLTATHPDGAPQIEYFIDGHKVATDSAAPYGVTFQDLPVGVSLAMRCVDPFGFGHLMNVDCTVVRENLADWMSRHGISDSSVDSDGDGMSDANEYYAGTDPLNAASKLVTNNFVADPAGMILEWRGVANDSLVIRGYQVECSSDLSEWIDYGPLIPLNGSGAYNATLPSVESADHAFYRVRSIAR